MTPAALPKLKKWGQHFLADSGIARRIVAAAEIGPGESVIEVGPGGGALTALLAETPGRVLAVEIDPRRAAALERDFSSSENVRVVAGDFLSRSVRDWLATAALSPPAVLVGNLPYNVATRILAGAVEQRAEISRIVATVQQEVARRLVARPGDEAYGYLSVRMSLFARTKLLFDIRPGAFRPAPKVVSTVVGIVPREPPVAGEELDRLLEVVSRAFRSRRKTLANALSGEGGRARWLAALLAAGLPEKSRAEELDADDFLRLLRAAPARDE